MKVPHANQNGKAAGHAADTNMGGNYALGINMFEDPNTKNPGKKGCVRKNVDTVNMEKKGDFGVRSGEYRYKHNDSERIVRVLRIVEKTNAKELVNMNVMLTPR